MADKLNIEIGAKIDDLKKKVTESTDLIKRMAATAKKIAIAGILIKSFTMLKGVLSDTITRLDALGKSARSIGVNVETFQKWAFAARRNNMDLGRFSQGIQKMARAVDDANDGMATQIRNFQKLGLDYRKLAVMKPEEVFDTITAALVRQTNAIQRASLANKIFGRAGKDVLNMARQYKELGQEMEDLGLIIGEDVVNSAEDAKDAIENLNTSLLALIGQTGAIELLADSLKDIARITTGLRGKKGLDEVLLGLGGSKQGGLSGWQRRLLDMAQVVENERAQRGGRAPLNLHKYYGYEGYGLGRTGVKFSGAVSRDQIEDATLARKGGGSLANTILKGKSQTMGQALGGDPFLRIGGFAQQRPSGYGQTALQEFRAMRKELEAIALHTGSMAQAETLYWTNQIRTLFTNGVQ